MISCRIIFPSAPHLVLQDDHPDLFDLIRLGVRASRLQGQDLLDSLLREDVAPADPLFEAQQSEQVA